MHTIELTGLRFYAHHGLYEEEKKLGGWFEVNLHVHFEPENFPVQALSDTIDYMRLYSVVKERMQIPTPLMETIAGEIAQKILSEFLLINHVEVNIKKLNAPIASFEGTTGVSISLDRK